MMCSKLYTNVSYYPDQYPRLYKAHKPGHSACLYLGLIIHLNSNYLALTKCLVVHLRRR